MFQQFDDLRATQEAEQELLDDLVNVYMEALRLHASDAVLVRVERLVAECARANEASVVQRARDPERALADATHVLSKHGVKRRVLLSDLARDPELCVLHGILKQMQK